MKASNVLRIARWETTRSAGDVDRKTAAAFAVVLVLLAVLVPTLLAVGPTPGAGIYRVGVAEDSQYHAVVQSNPTLTPVHPAPDAVASGRAEVHPIAAISPLTVVVDSITGAGTAPGPLALSTVPPALAATVLFGLGVGVYREEDMFTQLPIPAKFLDALAGPLTARWRVGVWTALFLPFVFVAELFAVAVLFVAPVSLSVPLLLAAVAVVEELAKSGHVFAGFERSKFPRTGRTALVVGAASGVGFFLGEKLLLLAQLVGLPGIDAAQFAFSPAAVGLPPGVLLVAPLALHVVTASISALGAARSRLAYAGAFTVAIVVHVAYNLAVVSAVA